jgi:hypothetical protein
MQDNFMQELQATSKTDRRLNWMAGIHYANDREGALLCQDEPLANALELALFRKTIEQHFGNAPIDPNGNNMALDNRITKEEVPSVLPPGITKPDGCYPMVHAYYPHRRGSAAWSRA